MFSRRMATVAFSQSVRASASARERECVCVCIVFEKLKLNHVFIGRKCNFIESVGRGR